MRTHKNLSELTTSISQCSGKTDFAMASEFQMVFPASDSASDSE